MGAVHTFLAMYLWEMNHAACHIQYRCILTAVSAMCIYCAHNPQDNNNNGGGSGGAPTHVEMAR